MRIYSVNYLAINGVCGVSLYPSAPWINQLLE